MSRRGRVLAAIAVAGVAVIVGFSTLAVLGLARGDAAARDCPAQLKADEATVRTDRLWSDKDLPGIGAYVEVHWQVHAAGDPCVRAPGPTDWHYQGVVRLRAEDASALLQNFDWKPVPATVSPSSGEYAWDTPTQMWSPLVGFVPGHARWLHSDGYATSSFQHGRWGDLYLDPVDAMAFFVLYDH